MMYACVLAVGVNRWKFSLRLQVTRCCRLGSRPRCYNREKTCTANIGPECICFCSVGEICLGI